jgi:hypothetical protein
VAARIRRGRGDGYDRIFVAYADCGTGGLLDRVLEAEGVARLEGAHCYEVYAGRAAFASLADAEPGTFYLTDFLVRNFDRLVIRGLGLDRHPELLPLYFGNYRRLVYLAQTEDSQLSARAEAAAATLGLAYERRLTGLGELAPAVAAFAASASIRASQATNPAEPGESRSNPSIRSRSADPQATSRPEEPRIRPHRDEMLPGRQQVVRNEPNLSRAGRTRQELLSDRLNRRRMSPHADWVVA